ncbi:phage portal protein [Puteibacter caeruleilacunae]|nr:phage portal protein [Puteibacter caeruleilacunae]
MNVNHDTSLKFVAIRILSENIASLPKMVVKQKASGKKVLFSHPVHKLIHRKATDIKNAFTLWEFINVSVDGNDSTYAVIERKAYSDRIRYFTMRSFLNYIIDSCFHKT